ncbi:MAG TPA: hypothetical protein VJV78_03785 [Polyangiales bacterium]|nr:hypothetical protein [Polyangiales bacterium]
MQLAQRFFATLPDRWQFEITGALGQAGLLPHVPLARMFLRTLVYCGGQPDEIDSALRAATPGRPSAGVAWRRAASSAAQLGEGAYLRAALYASVANWGVLDREERARNQALVERYFERYAASALPRLEAVELVTAEGRIAGIFRVPAHVRGGVILCHGFDQTKEWMAPFEAAAHAQGFASLSIDLPGMGASGVAGSRLRHLDVLGGVCRAAVDCLQRRVVGPIATFGVSGGGLAALAASAFDPRVSASLGVGAPYSLARILPALPAQQRQHYLSWSGCSSTAELRGLIDAFELAPALRRARARCLIVHGTRDEVVPVADARELSRVLGPSAELLLVRGDDHMCTHALSQGAAQDWFRWLAGACPTRPLLLASNP